MKRNLNGIGTKLSGFADGGPFHCGNCVFNENGYCTHPKVMRDPELDDRKTSNGLVKIGPNDCCNYVVPKKDIPAPVRKAIK